MRPSRAWHFAHKTPRPKLNYHPETDSLYIDLSEATSMEHFMVSNAPAAVEPWRLTLSQSIPLAPMAPVIS